MHTNTTQGGGRTEEGGVRGGPAGREPSLIPAVPLSCRHGRLSPSKSGPNHSATLVDCTFSHSGPLCLHHGGLQGTGLCHPSRTAYQQRLAAIWLGMAGKKSARRKFVTARGSGWLSDSRFRHVLPKTRLHTCKKKLSTNTQPIKQPSELAGFLCFGNYRGTMRLFT
jgi:hypothetical protein